MAGKPELSAASGVQNVVVYLSNDNFAQTYAVNQHHGGQSNHMAVNNDTYSTTSHPVASVVVPIKPSVEKQTRQPEYHPACNQMENSAIAQHPDFYGSRVHTVISENGFTAQPAINHSPFHAVNNEAVNVNNVKNYRINEIVLGERQPCVGTRSDLKVRSECNETYYESGYVNVMGAEALSQSVRCDSVRSETAESSCSSISSVDDSLIVAHSQTPDMVVYDSNVSVRPAGVILAVAPSTQPQVTTVQPPSITVPNGWKRLSNNGEIIYISPSNTALNSLEQVKGYLQTSGTCKCGLECPFKYDVVFNFDPKVVNKPWVPNMNNESMTKLCNHKRKFAPLAPSGCGVSFDPPRLLTADYGMKKKRRRIKYMDAALPHVLNVDKGTLRPQTFMRDEKSNYQQVWPVTQPTNQLAYHPTATNSVDQQMLKYNAQTAQLSNVVTSLNGETLVLQQPALATGLIQQAEEISNISVQSPHCSPKVEKLPTKLEIGDPKSTNIQANTMVNCGTVNQLIANGGIASSNCSNVLIPTSNLLPSHDQTRICQSMQQKESSGPGRPVAHNPSDLQQNVNQKLQQQMFCNHSEPYQNVHLDTSKIRPPYFPNNMNNFLMSGCRPQVYENQQPGAVNHMSKVSWQNRMALNMQHQLIQQNRMQLLEQNPQAVSRPHNVYDRGSPFYQSPSPVSVWSDDMAKRKVKINKAMRKRAGALDNQNRMIESHEICPNIDIRQIINEGSRPVLVNQIPQHNQNAPSPSFLEDPSGYLAQQTALLNNTINRQTGGSFIRNVPPTSICTSQHQNAIAAQNSQNNGVPLPSNVLMSAMKNPQSMTNTINQNMNIIKSNSAQLSGHTIQYENQATKTHSPGVTSAISHQQCHGCISDNVNTNSVVKDRREMPALKVLQQPQAGACHIDVPCVPQSVEDPVTSSTHFEKYVEQEFQDPRPIQGGTVSTSNVSPVEGFVSNASSPNRNVDSSQIQESQVIHGYADSSKSENYVGHASPGSSTQTIRLDQNSRSFCSAVITTMASGRTVGSNTITSVLAGRANTATVSVNNPTTVPVTSVSCVANQITPLTSSPAVSATVTVSKSPLEMVQSVVSSIQVPHSQQPHTVSPSIQISQQISPTPFLKHSPSQNIPPSHILVSSGGQIIIASSESGGAANVMPPPAKVVANSVASSIATSSGTLTQVVPAVGQHMLSQQTLLVNTLPAPFVLQPGVTMTVDGMAVGQNVPISHLVAGNVIPQPVQVDGSDNNRHGNALSPESKKKCKKRKMSPQTVANMLHIAAQQNSGVLMAQNFPQQIQMAHSPQGMNAAGQVMQALTIVSGKPGAPAQIVMNSQPLTSNAPLAAQQLLTNSQPSQQINLLQPVNLLNGTAGVVQHFPTIQQFIVPNLGGMVMNPDGTATILQDTSNLSMQLQLQNVNGQSILTPVQNNNMFNGGQSILASPGMVIRAPSTPQGKIIQQPQSPGSQFIPSGGGQFVLNGTQFNGQLSPLVANVSPTQQMTFGSTPSIRTNTTLQQVPQEFMQCGQAGQTLMVPCTPTASTANQQSTTFVQQNTTIVQQQTTMVANNQQLQSYQRQVNPQSAAKVDQNFILNQPSNKQGGHASSEPCTTSYRQSVSTQTAVNQASQSVTTNTFCQTSTISASSSPDTTTHSPIAREGHSSPVNEISSNVSGTDFHLATSEMSTVRPDVDPNLQHNCSMAMVHCISSSEPDLAEISHTTCGNDIKFERIDGMNNTGDSYISRKVRNETHLAYAESSTLVSDSKLVQNALTAQDTRVTSENLEKWGQKYSAAAEQRCSSLFGDDEEGNK